MGDVDLPLDMEMVSPAVRRHVGSDVPPQLRMMAAKGLAPMAPKDVLTAQFLLTFDSDPQVVRAAETSLANLDDRLAKPVLSDATVAPPVLGHLAQVHGTQDAYIEALLLNPSTPTGIFEQVAAVCSEPTAELIANNQARLLETPDIVRGLILNPNALKSTLERVIDFLVRNGLILENVKEFDEALLRLSGDERLAAAAQVEIPLDLIDERALSDEEKEALQDGRIMLDDDSEANEVQEDLSKLPLEERMRRMTLPQLVAFATKGNKTVRKTLLRHNNRVIALAAVTSPMIQEPEIIEAANSKVTHTDVLSHIVRDRKNNWIRIYQVKFGVVSNPKTPLPEAMRLLPTLNKKDLRNMAKSRNVAAGVRSLAARLSRQH